MKFIYLTRFLFFRINNQVKYPKVKYLLKSAVNITEL